VPIPINRYRSLHVGASVIAVCLMVASGSAQTAREVRGAAAVEPLQHEPPAKIIIDSPLPEPLSRGRVVIQYRTENLHIVPVFGAAALAVQHFVLLEALTEHIAGLLREEFGAPWVRVSASKLGVVKGVRRVSVTIERGHHVKRET